MARPVRCRRITAYPANWVFTPDQKTEDSVVLQLDEYETIRLIDHLQRTQEECAAEMNVSRATVAGIYENARRKLADALVNGKQIRIGGGVYRMADSQIKEKTGMRIAVTYENREVGQHFGRTEQFKVYEVENGTVQNSRVIDTDGFGHGALAGFLRNAGVDVLICGGIGMGARYALQEMGIELLPGVSGDADQVVASCLAGELEYDPEAACHHHDHDDHECHHDHEEGHCHCHE